MAIIVERDCDEADEFLNILSPRGELFGSQEAIGSYREMPDHWIYRGHSDDTYLMIPSALRGTQF